MKKLTFFVIFIILGATTISLAEFLNTKIIPLKKPLLEQAEIEKRLAKEEIRPIPKPGTRKNIDQVKTEVEVKEKKKIEKVKTEKKQEKKSKVAELILPKKKPITINTEKIKTVNKSKYYNKKDFELAKKAISKMEKREWK